MTTLAGRSSRTARLVAEAGITPVPDLRAVVEAAEILLVVTPPAVAEEVAARIAGTPTSARPLVADLNATSPSTVERIAGVLGKAGYGLVDGAISGPPPTVRPGATIFLSGPEARRIAELPWPHVNPVVVGEAVGAASATKMCTASVYKGTTALLVQALRTALHHGVEAPVLAELDDLHPSRQIAVAASKAWRFVPEMREIAATQRAAGQGGELFETIARVYEELARTELAGQDPESVDGAAESVLAALREAR